MNNSTPPPGPVPVDRERLTVYRCPRCGAYQTPTGEEAEYGPPECSHGLLFGTNPGGGGEAEMVPVEVVPARVADQLADELQEIHDLAKFAADTKASGPAWLAALDRVVKRSAEAVSAYRSSARDGEQ